MTYLRLPITIGFENPSKERGKSSEKDCSFCYLCKQIEEIIDGFLDVLADRNPNGEPKDDFKEKNFIAITSLLTSNSPPKVPLEIPKDATQRIL